MKLGKHLPLHDPHIPNLCQYLGAGLPPAPESCINSSKLGTTIGMMNNNTLGDCTCAAIGHAIQIWTSQASAEVTLTDDQIISLYSKVGGYVPGDESTDQGAIESDVLAHWFNNPIDGNVLSAYVSIEPGNSVAIKDAIYLFGGVYIGLALPAVAQNQNVWHVPPGSMKGDSAPGSWGGHAVFVCDYDSRGLTCITWGQKKTMTWNFWKAYCDEAYALLSLDWIESTGLSPEHFNLDQLQSDISILKTLKGA